MGTSLCEWAQVYVCEWAQVYVRVWMGTSLCVWMCTSLRACVNGVIAWLHMHGWDGMAYWEQLANIRKENAQNKQERRGSLSCGLSKLTCSKTRAVTLGHETMAHTSPLLLSLSGSAAIPCCTGHVCTTRVRVCVCVCVWDTSSLCGWSQFPLL
jgi:hypothetical protein